MCGYSGRDKKDLDVEMKMFWMFWMCIGCVDTVSDRGSIEKRAVSVTCKRRSHLPPD